MPSNFDHLDFIAGVRYIFIDTQFVFTPVPTLESDYSFVDPLIGARY